MLCWIRLLRNHLMCFRLHRPPLQHLRAPSHKRGGQLRREWKIDFERHPERWKSAREDRMLTDPCESGDIAYS